MQLAPVGDPCSQFDWELKLLEQALGIDAEHEAAQMTVVQVVRLVRRLVTELRMQEKERVRQIMGQI